MLVHQRVCCWYFAPSIRLSSWFFLEGLQAWPQGSSRPAPKILTILVMILCVTYTIMKWSQVADHYGKPGLPSGFPRIAYPGSAAKSCKCWSMSQLSIWTPSDACGTSGGTSGHLPWDTSEIQQMATVAPRSEAVAFRNPHICWGAQMWQMISSRSRGSIPGLDVFSRNELDTRCL